MPDLSCEPETNTVRELHRKLVAPETSLPQKHRVLFALRNIKGRAAHDAVADGLKDPSALFRHEVAYCMGQRQDTAAVDVLAQVLHDSSEHPMVRHEAGEALGAIGTPECLSCLEAFQQDPCIEVAQTCQLALQRIQYYASLESAAAQEGASGKHDDSEAAAAPGLPGLELTSESPYLSVDPTPAASPAAPTPLLRSLLLDEKARIFDRYTAMFALRNRGGPEAVEALSASFGSESALLKHEVAYVMGQMQDAATADILRKVLQDGVEHAMVRHEAAEALGSIADERSIELLTQHCQDPEFIVADSCEVALDMLEFERSGELDYVDSGVAQS